MCSFLLSKNEDCGILFSYAAILVAILKSITSFGVLLFVYFIVLIINVKVSTFYVARVFPLNLL